MHHFLIAFLSLLPIPLVLICIFLVLHSTSWHIFDVLNVYRNTCTLTWCVTKVESYLSICLYTNTSLQGVEKLFLMIINNLSCVRDPESWWRGSINPGEQWHCSFAERSAGREGRDERINSFSFSNWGAGYNGEWDISVEFESHWGTGSVISVFVSRVILLQTYCNTCHETML